MRKPTLLLLLAMLPAQLAAQRLSFSPELGVYIPTEKLSKLSTNPSDFTEMEAGISLGARLGLWFGSRIGFEASGAYVPGTYKLTTANDITKQDAKIVLGSGQVVVFLLPRTGFFTLYLNGGVGFINRGGAAYSSATKKTDWSGVFGGGAGIRLGPIGLTAGAELFNYSTAVSSADESVAQRDVRLKLGFGIPFGGAGMAKSAATRRP